MRRRDVLKAGALLAAPLGGPAMAEAAPIVAIFDSRHPASRRWAQAQPAMRRLDAQGDVLRIWRELAPSGVGLAGLTTWADFLVISGCAAEARRRVRHSVLRSRQGRGMLVSWIVT